MSKSPLTNKAQAVSSILTKHESSLMVIFQQLGSAATVLLIVCGCLIYLLINTQRACRIDEFAADLLIEQKLIGIVDLLSSIHPEKKFDKNLQSSALSTQLNRGFADTEKKLDKVEELQRKKNECLQLLLPH